MHAEQAYLFRHALLRDAAYQLHPPAERTRLHAMVLELLEAVLPEATLQQYALELATHAALGGPQLQEKEVGYRSSAAEFAFARVAMDTAMQQWSLIASHPAADNRARERALRGCGDVLRRRGNATGALEVYREALKLVQAGSVDEGRLIRAIADCLYRLGEYEDAENHYRRAIELLRAADSHRGEATAWGNLGLLLTATGRSKEAESAYRRALRTFDEFNEDRERVVVLTNLANLLLDRSRPQEAMDILKETESIDRRIAGEVDPVTLGAQSMALQAMGRHDESNDCLQEALRSARRMGMKNIEATCLANLAGRESDSGRPQVALEHYSVATEICREIGEKRLLGSALVGRGMSLLDLGRITECLTSIDQGLAILAGMRASLMLAHRLCDAAKVHLKLGLLLLCREELDSCSRTVNESAQPALYDNAYYPLCLRLRIAGGQREELAADLTALAAKRQPEPGSSLDMAFQDAQLYLRDQASPPLLFGHRLSMFTPALRAALPQWWREHSPQAPAMAEKACPGVLRAMAALDNPARSA